MKTLDPPKAPAAVLDYAIDWARELDGDTIDESIWIVPAGLTKASDLHSDTIATAWLTGGMHGQKYMVTNRITTAAGRTDDQSFVLPVRQT